ncbi:hypothetical protein ZIOFF_029376 [Zingiber officinale]|uniref:Amine oxidase domain-containing protein n=1 Tax=Zingiber officinale TaxID=94328 RepID=A0A8J5LEE0_ZINOF|nr:hypothetical protein ZIOFF_029376 [Zingiber officinale]
MGLRFASAICVAAASTKRPLYHALFNMRLSDQTQTLMKTNLRWRKRSLLLLDKLLLRVLATVTDTLRLPASLIFKSFEGFCRFLGLPVPPALFQLLVVLLESRDRIGGRVHTNYSFGFPVHMGAAWLHGVCNKNPLASWIGRLGLPIYRTSGDNSVLYDHDLERYETNEDMSIAQAIKLVEFEGLGELRSKDEEDEGLGELRSKDEEDEGI